MWTLDSPQLKQHDNVTRLTYRNKPVERIDKFFGSNLYMTRDDIEISLSIEEITNSRKHRLQIHDLRIVYMCDKKDKKTHTTILLAILYE